MFLTVNIPSGNSLFHTELLLCYDLIIIIVLSRYVATLPFLARGLCVVLLKTYLCCVAHCLCGVMWI